MTLVKGGSEPLSERELRTRLARRLVWSAVVNAIHIRPTAPCWESWIKHSIPALSSDRQLLQWCYHCDSASHQQQCRLLQALAVAPADLVAGMRLSPVGDDMFAWPVTPLLNLLTEPDMELLLREPAAVAAWCRQQLCRPPAERPAGLTAELNTPQGRAELLLQPELFHRAITESVPADRDFWEEMDKNTASEWADNYLPLLTYQECREKLERYLTQLRKLDNPLVAATARFWEQRLGAPVVR